MVKCAYRGERIREIEEKWVDENERDEEEKIRRKELLKNAPVDAGCVFDAIEGREFCIFHDPNYWKENPEEVRRQFLKYLVESDEKIFGGFHLPSVSFPRIIKKEIHMEFTKFHGLLDGNDRTFESFVDFTGAEFEEASFSRTKFKGEARFDIATFKGEAWFIGTEFEEDASFVETDFRKDARFIKAKFKKLASFFGTKFKGDVGFNGTAFRQLTLFNNTEFEGQANFYGAGFKGVNFDEAIFRGKTRFNIVTFGGKTSFIGTEFKEASFHGAIFLSDCVFRDLRFSYIDLTDMIRLRNVTFMRQKRVVFDNVDMTRISLINTPLDRVRFRNIYWSKGVYDGKLLLLKNSDKERESFVKEELGKMKKEKTRNKCYEEEMKRQLTSSLIGDTDLTLDNVLGVYRSLRDNHDYYLKYEESGRFFVNEMKLRRKLLGKEEIKGSREEKARKRVSYSVEKLAMWSYELLALYGESYVRPILWTVVLILMFSFIRPLMLQNFSLDFILKEMRISLLAFFQLHWDLKTLTVIERLLSIPVLGTLVIALRRKLERRIRH